MISCRVERGAGLPAVFQGCSLQVQCWGGGHTHAPDPEVHSRNPGACEHGASHDRRDCAGVTALGC